MARPGKAGLDYFPLDTSLDRKFEILEAKHGLAGFAIMVKLLQRIYGENGYYTEFTDIDALLLGSRYGLTDQQVLAIVETAVEVGIFHRGLYEEKQILTSKGIQKRYYAACGRRQNLDILPEYLLIDVRKNRINVYNNPVNVCNNSINVCRNSTKERKVKEKKVKESKEDDRDIPPRDVGGETSPSSSVFARLEELIGPFSRTIAEALNAYLDDEMEPEVIMAAIDSAEANGKRNWRYVKAILDAKLRDGIKTLDGFKRAEAEFRARKDVGPGPPRKNRFSNYVDTNKTDYEALENQLFDMMMEDGDG